MQNMNKEIAEQVRIEMLKSANIAQKLYKIVIDESESVAQGLLSAAFAFAILSKCSQREISIHEMIDLIRAAHELVNQADGPEDGSVH